jgi:hypothetical protein
MEPLVHGAAAAQAGRVARAVAQAAWELNRSRMCAEKKVSSSVCSTHSLVTGCSGCSMWPCAHCLGRQVV